MLANVLAVFFFDGQRELLFRNNNGSTKYSYHATIFPHYNPGELDRNLPQKNVKRL
jgi:hypothetical protein